MLFRSRAKRTDEILVVDCGLSRILQGFPESPRTLYGTRDYMAPEVLLDRHGHDKPVDMWAIGVITYALLCGRLPFKRDSYVAFMVVVGEADYSFTPANIWDGVSGMAKDFIRRCLVRDPASRLTAHEALTPSFLSRLSDSIVAVDAEAEG